MNLLHKSLLAFGLLIVATALPAHATERMAMPRKSCPTLASFAKAYQFLYLAETQICVVTGAAGALVLDVTGGIPDYLACMNWARGKIMERAQIDQLVCYSDLS